MNQIFTLDYFCQFAFSVLRMSTPLIYCAMGALISRHVGAINMAMEGIMLTSALTGVVFSAFTQNLLIGLLGAIIGGLLISLIMCFMHLSMKAELMLTGVSMNQFASGITVFALFAITGSKGTSQALNSLVVPKWDIPLIKDIPVLGDILSGHNWLTYIAFVLVILTYFLIFRTSTGLRIRAVGFNAHAAESVGINVKKIKYQAFLYSGAFAALGGAFMSMGYLSFFASDMMAGRGFIGIAAQNLAAGNVLGSMLASLGFGASDALAITLQTMNMPSELVRMIPYLATVIGLVIFSAIRQKRAEKKRDGK